MTSHAKVVPIMVITFHVVNIYCDYTIRGVCVQVNELFIEWLESEERTLLDNHTALDLELLQASEPRYDAQTHAPHASYDRRTLYASSVKWLSLWSNIQLLTAIEYRRPEPLAYLIGRYT